MKSSFAWRYANARKGKFQFRLRQDNITKEVYKLLDQLDEIDIQLMYGEKDMWDSMEKLMRRIRSMLLKADRRIRR